MKYLTSKQNRKQKFQMEEDYLGTGGSGRSGHISITLWSRCGGGRFPGRLRDKTEIYRQWVSFAYLIDREEFKREEIGTHEGISGWRWSLGFILEGVGEILWRWRKGIEMGVDIWGKTGQNPYIFAEILGSN